jgi:hypothetical protein
VLVGEWDVMLVPVLVPDDEHIVGGRGVEIQDLAQAVPHPVASVEADEIPYVKFPLLGSVELAAIQQHLRTAQAGSSVTIVYAFEVNEESLRGLARLQNAPAFTVNEGSNAFAKMATGAGGLYAQGPAYAVRRGDGAYDHRIGESRS